MCEFKVFVDEEKVFEEAVYVKTTENGVVLRDILGKQKVLKGCYVQEVDVASEKLTLSSGKPVSASDNTIEEELRETLTKAAKFHGHLGPFLVVGVRMGQLALERLNLEPIRDQHGPLSVVVETGTKPPISCTVDGIQWSTGCTLGKGKIKVEDLGRPVARFNSGRHELRIQLKDWIFKKIEDTLKLQPLSFQDLNEEIISLEEEELFQVI